MNTKYETYFLPHRLKRSKGFPFVLILHGGAHKTFLIEDTEFYFWKMLKSFVFLSKWFKSPFRTYLHSSFAFVGRSHHLNFNFSHLDWLYIICNAHFSQQRNKEQEKEVLEWIYAVLGEPVPAGDYENILRDGIVLCKLANKLTPGCIKKIQERGTNFQLMENVQR